MKKRELSEFFRLIHSKLAVTTTSDGNYEGFLKFISISKQNMTFEHVYELPSGDYLGTMHIPFSSISSWECLESVKENFEISNFDSSEKLLNGEFDKDERVEKAEVIEMASEKHFVEYLPDHLKNNCASDFCIIEAFDSVFFESVNILSESTVIGASFHGPKISRDGILIWLCLCTSSCVYLFDIEKLGKSAFEKGLKYILESEDIEKVVHDCREITDCLHHMYNTKLNCIFDTQVADYLINMQMCTGNRVFKYVNSLDSCLFKYLKVPVHLLFNHNKSVLFEDELQFYQKRPVSKDFIDVLIKSCLYLLLLKEKQEKLLLSPYEKAVELSLNCIRSVTDSQVHMMHSVPHLMNAYLLETLKPVSFHSSNASDEFIKHFKDTLKGLKTSQLPERNLSKK